MSKPAELKSEQIIEKANTDRKSSVDKIFGAVKEQEAAEVGPTEIKTEEVKAEEVKVEEVKTEEKPVEEVKVEEVKVPTSELEEEIDFDAKPKEKVVEEELAEPTEKETQSMATLREQAQKNGRRAKELENVVTEKDLSLKSKDEEIERLRAELDKPSRVAADPMSSPKIKGMIAEIERDRDTFAMTLPNRERKAFSSEFEGMLNDFSAASNAQDNETKEKLIDALQEKIGTTIGDDSIRDVMAVLVRNSSKYSDISKSINNIGEIAEEEMISSSVSSWDEKKTKASALISTISDVSDDFIEANPNSPQSFVAKQVKSDPAYKDRSDKVKTAIIEAFEGKRPLTKDELQNLKDNEEVSGVKVKDFLKERGKRTAASRADFMKRTYIATMLAPDLPDMLAELAKYRQADAAKEAEKAALIESTTTRTPEEVKQAETKPSERPSAVGRVLSAMK